MLKIEKKKYKFKNKNFFISILGNINIFFIDEYFIIPKNIKIKLEKNKQIIFENKLNKSSLIIIKDDIFLQKKNKLFLIINKKMKKSLLILYKKIINIKIKSIQYNFRIKLILKGLGFKIFLQKKNLILKLGFSHNISIFIPSKIKIKIKNNILIFSSADFIFLTQFIHYIRELKKPEIYKEKGLFLENETIYQKEGKKNKK